MVADMGAISGRWITFSMQRHDYEGTTLDALHKMQLDLQGTHSTENRLCCMSFPPLSYFDSLLYHQFTPMHLVGTPIQVMRLYVDDELFVAAEPIGIKIETSLYRSYEIPVSP